LNFTLQPNDGAAVRSGSIVLTSGSLQATFPVAQDIARSIAIAPANATVAAGGSLSFIAKIDGVADNSNVSWRVNAGAVGTISSTGVYTLPSSVPANVPVDTVTATFTPIPSLTATASVYVTPPQQVPASPVSVTPQSGTGTGTTFSVSVNDPAGFNQIASVNLRFGATAGIVSDPSCTAQMLPTSSTAATVDLFWDNQGGLTTGYIPYNSPGVSTLNATYCTLSVPQTSMTGVTGTNMTANFAMTFASTSFGGGHNTLVSTQGVGYASAFPETQMGGYTVVGGPAVSPVSPSSGTGKTVAFTAQYSDPAGAGNLQTTEFLVSDSTAAHANACYVQYRAAENAFYLRDDVDSKWLGGFRPGTAIAVSNSQCSLTGAGGAVSSSGNTLSVTLPITFQLAFGLSGSTKFIYGMAVDNNGVSSSYQQTGSWRVAEDAADFVTQSYQDYLNRAPSPAEASSALTSLNNGSVSRAQWLANLYNGTEFQSKGLYIQSAALALTTPNAQPPTGIDMARWVTDGALMATGGWTQDQMVNDIIAYRGLNTANTAANNQAFVTALYYDGLLRAPDSGGLNYWAGLITANSASRSYVTEQFIASGEFTQKQASGEFIYMAYVCLLRRVPDSGGYAGWLAALNGGASQAGIIDAFLASPEYLARFR
jgi:hypothetical protein